MLKTILKLGDLVKFAVPPIQKVIRLTAISSVVKKKLAYSTQCIGQLQDAYLRIRFCLDAEKIHAILWDLIL